MGCFDTIVGKCPVCHEDFDIQTKLGDCLLGTLGIGDAFPFGDEGSCKVFLHTPCPKGHFIMMVIRDRQISAFEDPLDDFDFDYIEGYWGNYVKASALGGTKKPKESMQCDSECRGYIDHNCEGCSWYPSWKDNSP